MKIKTSGEIFHCVNDGVAISETWVAVDELIERIETICNHGNERDMRFRNYLLKELKDNKN